MKQTKIIFERKKVRKGINLLCRCGIVLGFISFIGIWGGMEFGSMLIGRRILWTALNLLLIGGAAYGDMMTGEG